MKPLFFFLTLLLGTGVRAQDNHHALALEAYLANDYATWQRALAATQTIEDERRRLLIQAEYRLNSFYAAAESEDEDQQDAAIDGADELLDRYWELNEKSGPAHGIYSGLLGLRIARKSMLGIIHGSRAGSYAEDAIQLAPNDPVALYHAAGNLYYTPERWGGDPAQALKYLQKALSTYGEDRDRHWRYLATLALLGQVQQRLGDTEAARATYAIALQAQPEFAYVSKVLLPELK